MSPIHHAQSFLFARPIMPLMGSVAIWASPVFALDGQVQIHDPSTVIPHDGDNVMVSGTELTWHAVDTNEHNVNPYYFAHGLGKPTSNVLFWAVTIINCSQEMPGVRLAIGSNAASVWWVNGQEVIGIYGDRQTVIDDGVSKRLTLKKGPNIVRGAIVNGGGATDFCARFLDREDKPLKGFTLSVGAVKQP